MALTTQQLFSNAIIAYMSELEGGKLKKFCETMTQTGGDSITFNRLKKSKGNGTLVSMFSTDPTDGGDMKDIKAPIKYIGEQMKISDEDIKKTAIDIKSAYVKSLSRGVMRREDSEIIAKIVASTPIASPGETAATKVQTSGDWAQTNNIDKLVKAIKRAQAKAEYTPDGHQGVALVMSADDWADLYTSDYCMNADYAVAYGGDGKPTSFFGAEIVLMDDTNVGNTHHIAYVIPSNTICFGEWEGSVRGDAIFMPTDKMRWHLQAVKSIGVALAEPNEIVQFTNQG